MKILGSTAIVTGAARGLGRAFSEELLKRGGRVNAYYALLVDRVFAFTSFALCNCSFYVIGNNLKVHQFYIVFFSAKHERISNCVQRLNYILGLWYLYYLIGLPYYM